MIYHGSKTSGIKILSPFPHSIVDNEKVVFATNDIRFALAMIHGTSAEIDVGHEVNKNTGEEKMYMKELIPKTFKKISKPGTIYILKDSGFIHDSRLSRSELISIKETKVVEEKYYKNIFQELQKLDIEIMPFMKRGVRDTWLEWTTFIFLSFALAAFANTGHESKPLFYIIIAMIIIFPYILKEKK